MVNEMRKMITCQNLLDSLSEYIDGALSPAFCADLERHLCECHDCQVVLDTTRKTIELYRVCIPGDEGCVPGDIKARLYKKLELDKYL
jgi:hypothetical protein